MSASLPNKEVLSKSGSSSPLDACCDYLINCKAEKNIPLTLKDSLVSWIRDEFKFENAAELWKEWNDRFYFSGNKNKLSEEEQLKIAKKMARLWHYVQYKASDNAGNIFDQAVDSMIAALDDCSSDKCSITPDEAITENAKKEFKKNWTRQSDRNALRLR